MKTRIISALVALSLFTLIYYLWQDKGLYVATSLIACGCSFEYSRLTLKRSGAPLHIRSLFFLVTVSLFFVTVFASAYSIYLAAIGSMVFLAVVLVTVRNHRDLLGTLHLQSAGLLGFVYCGIFPALAVSTLNLEDGSKWLFGLMAIVFGGDSFAYLVGKSIGRRKLLEPVSPKKTIEGAMGGLLGSALGGVLLHQFLLPQYPLWAMVLMAIVTGVFAQIGDLFESLLKRIAEVKDSGSIMPGHGGFLDRLDGVLFSAPIYFVLAKLLTGR